MIYAGLAAASTGALFAASVTLGDDQNQRQQAERWFRELGDRPDAVDASTPIEGFSVLNSKAAIETLPSLLQQNLRGLQQNLRGSGYVGADRTLYSGTTALRDGRTALVASDGTSICLSDVKGEEIGLACTTVKYAAANGLMTFISCEPGISPGKMRVIGLVPDRVSALTFRTEAGSASPQVVQVADNAFEVEISPDHTQLTSDDGSIDKELDLESMALAPGETCSP